MKKNKARIIQRTAQKRAEKERKRKKISQKTRNESTSLRETHVNKNDDEKRNYYSFLNDEHWTNDENNEVNGKIEEKDFEEPEIEADIPSTDSKIENSKQTGEDDYFKNENGDKIKKEKWYSRLREYWLRNYPELIVKEIFIKIISTVIIGVFSFLAGFWLNGSISDKKIKDLKDDFDNQIKVLKASNATTTEKIFNDLYNKKIEDINFNIDSKIDSRLNIMDAIDKINTQR
jgi:hypothetical protein